jgi:hypothetical protein
MMRNARWRHCPRAAGFRRADAWLVPLFAGLLCALSVPAAADNTAQALEAAGWTERAPGLFASLPQRTVEVQDSKIAGDFVLAPGTSLAWERRFRDARGPGNTLDIEIYSEGPNASSNDYREHGAAFPVSVTAVFGRDSLSLPVKRRVRDFFAAFWYGFRPGGIKLTFAAGSVAPAGSMYRTAEETTVFILVGDEERGKKISVRRDLAADFRAAYGRDPKGPVTRLIVRVERPSREKGTIKAGIRLAFPGK